MKGQKIMATVKVWHNVKCDKPYFDLVWNGYKPVEVRVNDRNYQAGDVLIQHEYDKEKNEYLGRVVRANINQVLFDVPGLLPEHVMLILTDLENYDNWSY